MPDPITAIIGSGAIGGIGSIAAAKSQEKASDKAADVQSETADKSIAESRRQYDQDREDLAPWRELGAQAVEAISAGLEDGSFSMDDFDYTKDPGYQFRMDEGEKLLNNSAAARGSVLSGQQLKNAIAYGQDFASNEYDRAYGRESGRKASDFARYTSAAGLGSSGVSQTVQAGQAATGRSINALTLQGNASAQNYINQGNISASMYGNLASGANQGIENYLTYKGLG